VARGRVALRNERKHDICPEAKQADHDHGVGFVLRDIFGASWELE
jgi:hypothetical protein